MDMLIIEVRSINCEDGYGVCEPTIRFPLHLNTSAAIAVVEVVCLEHFNYRVILNQVNSLFSWKVPLNKVVTT